MGDKNAQDLDKITGIGEEQRQQHKTDWKSADGGTETWGEVVLGVNGHRQQGLGPE